MFVVVVQQGGASAAGAWSRGRPSTAGAGDDVTGVRLEPRVDASIHAYRTINQLLMDYFEHVSHSPLALPLLLLLLLLVVVVVVV